MNAIDLFAGAGGLSEGFIQAGFKVIGHVEMDRNAAETLRTRMIYHELKSMGLMNVYENYLRGDITRSEIIEQYKLQDIADSVLCETIDDSYLETIGRLKNIVGNEKIDLIVGGPPCQAYSNIGRARDTNGMKNDARNFLYRYYIEFLKAFKPKAFVFENVPGLLSAGGGQYLRDMQKLMKQAGYDTDYKILNAADYGVPQNRRRVILIGWNDESGITSYPEPSLVKRNYSVKDVFSDLPSLQAGEGNEITINDKRNLILEKIGVTSKNFNILIDHRTRQHNARDLEIYRLAVELKSKGESLKYNILPEELKTHKNQTSFLDRYKVIDENAQGSHTVVAHIGKDGHYYIHPSSEQNRSLSIREAARLQTFPDDYKFEGARNSRYKQIGNAVPVLLAKSIADKVRESLYGKEANI